MKTKVITRNNEADDFTKELLGKLYYMAQSADNILVKNFNYLSDKLSYTTFACQIDKNDPLVMEVLVFDNKRMITLFFKLNIYDDTKNGCHNSELSYFCQLKDGVLYVPKKIYDIKLKKTYSFLKDIKIFIKKEYKNIHIKNIQIVNDDNFFFDSVNVLPYRYKLYSAELDIETLSSDERARVLNGQDLPLLYKDKEANKIYTEIDKMQMADLIRMENYDSLLIPKYIQLTYYEFYGFIEKGIVVLIFLDRNIKFFTLPDFKFNKVSGLLESNVFKSKPELDNVLEEMIISQINKLENGFLPSKQIENKEKFLQLMGELYDRRVEVKKEIFNIFNTEFNETIQELSAIVDKNKTDNIV